MSDPEPRLVDTGRGFTVNYKGKYLYSPLSPLEGVLKRVAGAQLRENTLVFIPGLGLGYGLRQLLERLPSGSHLLCVETDQRLMALAAASGFELPRDPRLTIIRTESPERAAAVLSTLGPWRFRRLAVLPLCGAYRFSRNTYRAIQDSLEEDIRLFWQNRLTLAHMSRLWLRNLFTNLSRLPESNEAGGLACSRPVLVTGAGPSLEDSLQQIARIRPRVVLLAVDTALPCLADAGIFPDWIFVLEAQTANLQDFLPSRDPSADLLCDLTANPSAVRLFPRRFFFSSRFHPLGLFDRLERLGLLPMSLPPLGSVGVAAVQAALALTSGPILISGLDFSYRPGKIHARGAPSHRNALIACGRLYPPGMPAFEALLRRPRLRLKGKRGRTVVSDLVLRSYSLQLRRIAGDSGRVFDLGMEGLPTGAVLTGSDGELEALLRSLGGSVGRLPPLRPSPGRPSPIRPPPGRPPLRALPAEGAFRPTRTGLKRFYAEELDLLRRSEEAILSLARRDQPSGNDLPAAELPPALKEVEYVLLPIPEADPRRQQSRGNLALALLAVRYFLRLLEHLSAQLELP